MKNRMKGLRRFGKSKKANEKIPRKQRTCAGFWSIELRSLPPGVIKAPV